MAARSDSSAASLQPPADGELEPELLRIILAMARADARRDYAAALQDDRPPVQGAPPSPA